MKKRILTLFLTFTMLLSLAACTSEKSESGKPVGNVPVNTGSAKLIDTYTDTVSGVFDDKNIVFTFAALSDIHLGGVHYSYEKPYNNFVAAIQQLKEASVSKKLDAVLVAGDLVDCTNSEKTGTNVVTGGEYPSDLATAYAQQSKKERENLLRAITDSIDTETKFFYCHGNHDSTNGNHAQDFIDSLSGDKNQYYDWFFGGDLDKEGLKKGNRHTVINGYNVLALEHGCGQSGYDWLEAKLDSIIKENPQQTIFLLHHYRPANVTFASAGQSKELRTLLKKYPQVIVFGGHTHSPLDFDNSLMQSDDGYISVDCGSVSYLGAEYIVTTASDRPINTPAEDIKNYSQGLLVEVDKSGNVRVSRYNFTIGKKIGDNFIIPAVKSNGTRELTLTKKRKDNIAKPQFLNANISAVKEGTGIRLKFPAAASQTQKIYRYEITVKNLSSGQMSDIIYVSSLFYKNGTPAEMPKSFDVTFSPSISVGKGKYEISVVAVDSWPLKSEPLKTVLEVK